MDETIERIIQKEYVMLGKVNNRGGRAACQDHFAVFRTMRASQFLGVAGFHSAQLSGRSEAGRSGGAQSGV